MRIGIYPGSFDPVTNGHIDIIERSAKLLDKLIVAIMINPSKMPLFSVEERILMIRESITHIDNVEICGFTGLLVDLAQSKNAGFIIRGLRAVTDFEYELQMTLMNKKLNSSIETLFLMTDSKYSYLSSSIVKEIAAFGGCLKGMVPPLVEEKLKATFNINHHVKKDTI